MMVDEVNSAQYSVLRRKNLRTGILLGLFAAVCFFGFLAKFFLAR